MIALQVLATIAVSSRDIVGSNAAVPGQTSPEFTVAHSYRTVDKTDSRTRLSYLNALQASKTWM